MMLYRYDFNKTCNKNLVFSYKINFRLIFLYNTDIKLPDLGHNPKIRIFIFMLMKRKASIRKLVTSNNLTKDA